MAARLPRLGKYLWCGLILATALIGCGPTSPCHTKAGVTLKGFVTNGWNSNPLSPSGDIPAQWDCDIVQTIEDRLVGKLFIYDPRALMDTEIWLVDRKVEKDPWGREVEGFTDCTPGKKRLFIWDTDDIRDGALAHEIAHQLQKCYSPLPIDPEFAGDEWWAESHADWYRDGIYAAVDEANRHDGH